MHSETVDTSLSICNFNSTLQITYGVKFTYSRLFNNSFRGSKLSAKPGSSFRADAIRASRLDL